MSKIFLTVKKTINQVVQVGGDVINFSRNVTPAPRLQSRLSYVVDKVAAGVKVIGPGLIMGLFPTIPSVSTFTSVSGDVIATNNPASVLQAGPQEAVTSQTPAGDIVYVEYFLEYLSGSTSTAANGSWNNATNAVGLNNGTNATNANSATTAASGELVLNYPIQNSTREQLDLLQVYVTAFFQYTAGLTSPGIWRFEYSVNKGTSWIIAESGNTSVSRTGGRFYDLTSTINTWDKVRGFRARFVHEGSASVTASTLSVDAVHFEFFGTRRDT